jgi:hypothetical protein
MISKYVHEQLEPGDMPAVKAPSLRLHASLVATSSYGPCRPVFRTPLVAPLSRVPHCPFSSGPHRPFSRGPRCPVSSALVAPTLRGPCHPAFAWPSSPVFARPSSPSSSPSASTSSRHTRNLLLMTTFTPPLANSRWAARPCSAHPPCSAAPNCA